MPKSSKQPLLLLALVIDEYERDLRRREVQPKTIRNYRKVLSLATRFWEERAAHPLTLNDFTLKQAESFLDFLIERGKLHPTKLYPLGQPLSPFTLRAYVRSLKVFSTWLAAPKQRYTTDNRLALLPMPRRPNTYKLPLDVKEIQALINACDVTSALGSRDLALLLAFLDGGLRASEMMALRVADVDIESGQIFITSGKGRKSRMVTVGEDTRRILRRYAFFRDAVAGSDAMSGAPFFQTDDGKVFHYDGLRNWLIRLKKRADVPRVFLHLLRHTSAIRTLEVPGSDLFTLQAKLGHSDISTTRRYLHMTSEKLSERQRTFSPVDHLGLDGLMRLLPPEKTDKRLWHKRDRKKEPD
jgi:integrase/recombinase XerD